MPANPVDVLRGRLERFKESVPSLSLDSEMFALMMDEEDPLARFRSKFEFPLLGSIPVGRSFSVLSECNEYCRGSERRPPAPLHLPVRKQPGSQAPESG